ASKAAFARGVADGEQNSYQSEMGMAGEILGALGMDNETISKIGRARSLYEKGKAAGGGKFDLKTILHGGSSSTGSANGQQVYPYGTILNGHVATPQGWVPVSRPQPPPAPLVRTADQEHLPAAKPSPDLPPELPSETKS
ncbi:MAG: hypothetical protein ACRECR_04575, partial [Thermoplasmata archaeon]